MSSQNKQSFSANKQSFSANKQSFSANKNVTVEEVKKLIDSGGDFLLLDVRSEGEYLRTKIPGSFNIPVEEITQKIEAIIPDKNKKIYVYCLSGFRSGLAVELMESVGYKNPFNVISGLLAWRSKGYPLE